MRIALLTIAALVLTSQTVVARTIDLPGGLELPAAPMPFARSAPRPYIEYHDPSRGGPPVTMVIDRGPIAELTVTCGHGSFGIISYSKIEKLFCDPHLHCTANFAATLQKTCGTR